MHTNDELFLQYHDVLKELQDCTHIWNKRKAMVTQT